MSPRTVIEVSWEVVNKVGGIHTVVKSKASLLAEHYENYLLVGPLFPERRDIEFKEQPAPEQLRLIFEQLRQSGIECVYGQWLIPGNPNTILVDARNSQINVDDVKGLLWESYEIDSLHAAGDFAEPVKWSWAVGMLIEKLQLSSDKPIVGHFHEWMAGLAILYLKHVGAKTGTVFTTHATMLGRTISAATDIQLYDSLEHIDAPRLARDLGIADKYSTEVACAKHCDTFTTVSEITAIEAEHLLGRQPDVLLFNGIQGDNYPTVEETSVLHIRARERIRDFLDYFFFSHYSFDLDQSLIFFISGRYEYHNKGMDVLTEALGRLNEHLKAEGHKKTIVCFYFIPGEVHGIKTELLEERATFSNIQQFIAQHAQDITRKILRNANDLGSLGCEDLLTEKARRQIEHMAHQMEHPGNPPLVSHNIPDEEHDAIIAGFKAHGLLNREEDKVKVIRYPVYLTGSDGLLDLSYNDAIAGAHLGIFPSYYEPWGYTPVESAAMGVPAITTDLAGFGRFIEKTADAGIYVLKRHGVSNEESAKQLFEMLKTFCELDKFGRQDEKLVAKKLVHLTEWETFIKHYYQAHEDAFQKQS